MALVLSMGMLLAGIDVAWSGSGTRAIRTVETRRTVAALLGPILYIAGDRRSSDDVTAPTWLF